MISQDDIGKMVIDEFGYVLKLTKFKSRPSSWTAELCFDDKPVCHVYKNELHAWAPVPENDGWITTRLPSANEAYMISEKQYMVLTMDSITKTKPIIKDIKKIELGDPWKPIPQWHSCRNCNHYQTKNDMDVCWLKGVFSPAFGLHGCCWKAKEQ